ncbi:MAG: GNAT family N-acetyltransferase [Syntrophomonas sp.]
MEDVLIRPAKEDDLEAILSLYAQPDLDNGEVLTKEQAVEVFTKMQRYPDYKIYVAESGSTIVGTFTLLIMDNLGHLGAPSGVIEDVAVDPKWQGQGIGTKMMQYAMGIGRLRGCYKVALSSNVKRRRAHHFYEKVGFSKHGYSFLVD